MNANKIKEFINESSLFSNIIVKKSVTSTNTLLKEMATAGAPEWTILIADEQTCGRGRLGRSFHSPTDTGIYFSILLRPTMPAYESLFLTTAAAVAVAKSIEKICDCKADIKWVNDIYINDKKVCGILTEGSVNADGNLDYAIIGIGINVWNPTNNFPEELQSIAGAIFNSCNQTSYSDNFVSVKEHLIAEILNHFTEYYSSFSEKTFFEEYRKRSFLIGRKIYVLDGEKRIPATALDIDNNCQLIVELENGQIKLLSSGEVSIKLT